MLNIYLSGIVLCFAKGITLCNANGNINLYSKCNILPNQFRSHGAVFTLMEEIGKCFVFMTLWYWSKLEFGVNSIVRNATRKFTCS